MHHRHVGDVAAGEAGFSVTMTMRDHRGREVGSFEARIGPGDRDGRDAGSVGPAAAAAQADDAGIVLSSIGNVDSTVAMVCEDVGRDCAETIDDLTRSGLVERWRYGGVRNGCADLEGSTMHRLTTFGETVLARLSGDDAAGIPAPTSRRRPAKTTRGPSTDGGTGKGDAGFEVGLLRVLEDRPGNIAAIAASMAAEGGSDPTAIRWRVTRSIGTLHRAGTVSRTKVSNETGGGWSYVYSPATATGRPQADGGVTGVAATGGPEDAPATVPGGTDAERPVTEGREEEAAMADPAAAATVGEAGEVAAGEDGRSAIAATEPIMAEPIMAETGTVGGGAQTSPGTMVAETIVPGPSETRPVHVRAAVARTPTVRPSGPSGPARSTSAPAALEEAIVAILRERGSSREGAMTGGEIAEAVSRSATAGPASGKDVAGVLEDLHRRGAVWARRMPGADGDGPGEIGYQARS